jgi:hypothetical protein
MHTTKRTLLVLAAVLLLVGVVPVGAQEPSIAQGQLVKVDTAAQTLSIHTTQGTQMLFSYTADTKVIGAEEGVVEGLATRTGTDVTVHYVKKGQDNVATQIEVQKKQ